MPRNVLIWLVVLVVALGGVAVGVVALSRQWHHTAAPGGPPTGAAKAGDRGAGVIAMAQKLGATKEDEQKIRAYTQQRQQLVAELRQAVDQLQMVTTDASATDDEVKQALTTFRQKRDDVKQRLKAAEAGLTQQLNLDTRPKLAAGLTAFGVLDNGLGGGGRALGQRPAGGGRSGAPRARGGRRRVGGGLGAPAAGTGGLKTG